MKVIFTGAGTSAYVGDTILLYLKRVINEKMYELEAVPTTSIVSNPLDYFKKDVPTILFPLHAVVIVLKVLQQLN